MIGDTIAIRLTFSAITSIKNCVVLEKQSDNGHTVLPTPAMEIVNFLLRKIYISKGPFGLYLSLFLSPRHFSPQIFLFHPQFFFTKFTNFAYIVFCCHIQSYILIFEHYLFRHAAENFVLSPSICFLIGRNSIIFRKKTRDDISRPGFYTTNYSFLIRL